MAFCYSSPSRLREPERVLSGEKGVGGGADFSSKIHSLEMVIKAFIFGWFTFTPNKTNKQKKQ